MADQTVALLAPPRDHTRLLSDVLSDHSSYFMTMAVDRRRLMSTPALIDTSPKKEGDFKGQEKITNRLSELGLLETKTSHEESLKQRLESTMEEEDSIVCAIGKGKRQRQLRHRVTSVASEIQNIIKHNVWCDEEGRRRYKVEVLMGRFTRDVSYKVEGNSVVLCGTIPNGARLQKETRIEFPKPVDMSQLEAVFVAGVFKVDVPLLKPGLATSLSSSFSEEPRTSLTSDGSVHGSDDIFSEPEEEYPSQIIFAR